MPVYERKYFRSSNTLKREVNQSVKYVFDAWAQNDLILR